MIYNFKRELFQNFVERERELTWLDKHLFTYGSNRPIFIFGQAGIGKTLLLKHWLSSRRYSQTPLWLDITSSNNNAIDDLILQIESLRETHINGGRLIVVIDGTDIWSQQQHQSVANKILNYKAVSTLIFIKREPLEFTRSAQLIVEPFSFNSTKAFLTNLLVDKITDTQMEKVMLESKGHPLALSILSKLINNIDLSSLISNKPLYTLSDNIIIPEKEIIVVAKPIIISANNNLITSLQKQPGDLRKITPREFEQLLAELLRDMGWEVELTKQTRDGGSDILAYLNTDLGRLLCLVEAKHYREDRKIGVDLVRTLYGTLCDAQANSAMLVTSSSFSSGAKEFQQKHKYQLNLKDYGDVVEWILKYGNKKNNPSTSYFDL